MKYDASTTNMARHERDEFSSGDRRKLRERVANRCSNPGCRTLTIGPGAASDAVANIGKAAHIAAAAAGGPRFDASMTSQQRRSLSNGIWLCSNCATDVDADHAAYPATLLHEWKREAERRARAEKGRRLPEPDDARAAVLGALTAMTPKFTWGAIPSTHAAVQQLFREIDPRLSVRTSHVDGVTQYDIHALEQVDFKLQVPPNLAADWRVGLNDLSDHGREVHLPAAGLKITGSPVFDRLFEGGAGDGARIVFGTAGKNAVQKLRLTDPAGQMTEQFDDITGKVFFGRRSITFEGEACAGALAISMKLEMELGQPVKSTFNLSIRFEVWNHVDVRRLPYFEKLCSLIERVRLGWTLNVELEIDGMSVCTGRANMTDAPSVGSIAGMLTYVAMLRVIAQFMNARVDYLCDLPVSRDAFEAAQAVSEMMKGQRVIRSRASKPVITVTAEGDNIRRFLATNWKKRVMVYEGEGAELNVLGRTLKLPRCRIEAGHFRPRLLDHRNPATIQNNEAVRIRLMPITGFRLTQCYLRADEPYRSAANDAQPTKRE